MKNEEKNFYRIQNVKTTLAIIGLCTLIFLISGFNITRIWSTGTWYNEKTEYNEFACYKGELIFSNRFLRSGQSWTSKKVNCMEYKKHCNIYADKEVYDYWFFTKECDND